MHRRSFAEALDLRIRVGVYVQRAGNVFAVGVQPDVGTSLGNVVESWRSLITVVFRSKCVAYKAYMARVRL